MEIRAEEISEIIRKQIKEYGKEVEVAETGTIISIGDGIARIHGLDKAMAGELLEFPGGVTGMALNLEEDNVGAAILGERMSVRTAVGGVCILLAVAVVLDVFRSKP